MDLTTLKQLVDQYGLVGLAIPAAFAAWHWFCQQEVEVNFKLKSKRKP